MEAAKRFLAQLGPDDLVGLIAYPQAGVRVDPTNDHAKVVAGLEKVKALFEVPPTKYNVSAAEAIDIASNNGGTLGQVVERECAGLTGNAGSLAPPRSRSDGQSLGLVARGHPDAESRGTARPPQ